MSILDDEEFESNGETFETIEAPPEPMSVKLERRRKIEDMFEAKRLQEELAEYEEF